MNQLHNVGGLGHQDASMLQGGPMPMQSNQHHPVPMAMQTSPNSGLPIHPMGHVPHLTPLYGPNDDYMNANDCIPEPSGASQQKKRKVADSPGSKNGNISSTVVHIKREPGAGNVSPDPTQTSMIPSCENDFGFDYNPNNDGPSSVYLDSTYQCIRFQTFQQPNWHTLFDANLKEL